MKSTIEDVAKLAGVSITTVSRVINKNYPVKAETRLSVEAAIKQLDYQPNPMARGLIIKKSKMIGIVVPSITNLFFTEVIHGIEKALKQDGYGILLSNSNDAAAFERECVEMLLGRFVDGIIVVTPQTENLLDGFYDEIARKLPLICINGYNENANVNFILSDEEKGTKEALEYLIGLGHRDIAFVRGGESYSYDIKQKLYQQCMDRIGAKQRVLCVSEGNSIDVVKNTMNKILLDAQSEGGYQIGAEVTAFFACNDLMAAGIMNACGILGYSIPGDVSVVGFDNIILSEMMGVKLTTVDQNMRTIGLTAAKKILELIDPVVKNDKQQRNITLLTTKLVIRDSCRSI